MKEVTREGGLSAPTRHPIKWKDAEFYDEKSLNDELARVFDVCHGCRRCVNLCHAFPTLFDLIDASSTMEANGVSPADYPKVAGHCYLCDLCFQTKCPYVPPHEWNVDFPHLMLRAKAFAYKKGRVSLRDRVLSSTDVLGRIAGIPVVREVMNAAAAATLVRRSAGIHRNAALPRYAKQSAHSKLKKHEAGPYKPVSCARTTGKVAVFISCYNNYMQPSHIEDFLAVLEHNEIPTLLAPSEKCCGMPKLELGDLETVAKLKDSNIPKLLKLVNDGYDVIAPIPSCVLMFKQELPMMFVEDPDLKHVAEHVFDPAEYFMLRHKAGLLKTDFKHTLGKIVYHAACHTRVQNFGLKTRDLLKLVEGTELRVIERCSGHDGTYAVKEECYQAAVKIGSPAARYVDQNKPDYFTGDCVLAGNHIAALAAADIPYKHPISLLKLGYGI